MKQIVWKRKKEPAQPGGKTLHKVGKLSPEEQACVRVAFGVLKVRYGTVTKIAEAMGVPAKSLKNTFGIRGNVTVGMALEVARLAGVRIDAVLDGEFPEPGACPMCGRTGT
jgi:hypothetical protein